MAVAHMCALYFSLGALSGPFFVLHWSCAIRARFLEHFMPMAMSIEEVTRTLARFERQRSVISAALISEDVRARLLAQHDSAVALFAEGLKEPPASTAKPKGV